MSCAICAEGYNKSTRKCVACMYCAYEACRQCCQTYITTSTVTFPRCMNTECNREWTRKFLVDSFPQTFLNRPWKTHREQVLLDQERALLPATQPLVEDILHRQRLQLEIRQVNEEIRQLFIRRNRLQHEHYTVGQPADARGGGGGADAAPAAANRRTFVRACPDADCRGFLSTQWKCGLCEKWTCPDCHEVKGLDRNVAHECDPAQLATANLMRNDTRPCPNCGMGIYRIEGCSQMWCTQCNTGFCWNTGRIETRNIHNPHYFEWLRRGGADAAAPGGGGGNCERELTHVFVTNLRRTLTPVITKTPSYERINDICRNVIHMIMVTMPNYRVDHVLINQQLRVEYLRNRITDDQFRTRIQRDDKKNRKKGEILNVLQMMQITNTDIMYRLLNELRTTVEETTKLAVIDRHLTEMDQLIVYANECLRDVAIAYDSVAFMFTPTMDMVRHYTARQEAAH